MSQDYLKLYGGPFQLKVLANLMKDAEYVAKMYEALADDLFESDANNFILKVIKDYYTEYKTCPTLLVFKTKLGEQKNELLKQSVIENLREIMNHMTTADDLKFVQDEFENFCSFQKMKKGIMECVDLLKDGKKEECLTVIKEATSAFKKRETGHIYEEMVEERIINNPRLRVIPTEWPVINEIIDGGPGDGDLCVLVGSAGASKTWSLVSIGLHALKLGKNVFHFTLELNENYTAKRYDSKLTGIPSQNLKYNVATVKEMIESEIKGKLRIFFHPTKGATINTLKRQIDEQIAWGLHPDLIIVDYADLLRNDNIYHQKGGSYSEIGSIYEDLRGVAGEYKVPIWSASQSHRSAAENEIITGEQIAESYKKVMTADFVISVARKIEDKLANTARWHIIKNRYGPDGLTFPSKVDASIGKIEIYPPNTEKGIAATKDMQKGEALKVHKLGSAFRAMDEADKIIDKNKLSEMG